ncbi:hypothetical protein GCM10009806_25890 [Microbacterium flavum]
MSSAAPDPATRTSYPALTAVRATADPTRPTPRTAIDRTPSYGIASSEIMLLVFAVRQRDANGTLLSYYW